MWFNEEERTRKMSSINVTSQFERGKNSRERKRECRRWLLTTEYHETYEERTRVHNRGPENAREGFRSLETLGKEGESSRDKTRKRQRWIAREMELIT